MAFWLTHQHTNNHGKLNYTTPNLNYSTPNPIHAYISIFTKHTHEYHNKREIMLKSKNRTKPKEFKKHSYINCTSVGLQNSQIGDYIQENKKYKKK